VTRDEAVRHAVAVRNDHAVPPDAQVADVDPRFIELAEFGEERPGLVRDEYVWVVRFRSGIAWVDLAVADRNGQIVRVERSRASVDLAAEGRDE